MSSYKEGQIHQLANALEQAGFTAEHLTALGQNRGDILVGVRGVLNGVFQIMAKTFPTWKTITLGQHKSEEEYRKALKKADLKISDWAKDIMSQDAFALEEAPVNLVRVKVSDLGFTENTTRYDAICQRAKDLGLELCPAEVGPALRLAHKDQPHGEWIRVAMEPITDSDGYPNIFNLRHVLWLSADYGNPGSVWGPGDEFVFVSRNSS